MPMSELSRRNLLRLSGVMVAESVLECGTLGGDNGEMTAPTTPTVEPDGVVHSRSIPQLGMPLVECEGTARECGEQLGNSWKPALRLEAAQAEGGQPWWKSRRFAALVEEYTPHLPDVFRGMARGADIDENTLGSLAPKEDLNAGCTSFALAPEATLEETPISGQTKDPSVARAREMLVLRMKMSDAPSMLTVTYAGSSWLFGHGFVKGGTAIFRNNLYIDPSSGGLPYAIWGLLALHCATVGEVMELTDHHGVGEAFHVVVADGRGGILGIEGGCGGIAYLQPEQGIYVHGNAVLSDGRLRETEKDGLFTRADSVHRGKRLMERLRVDRGRLTSQLAYGALCDHDGYPVSICRHQSTQAHTGAAIIAEPTRGLLHVTRGAPCQNWPRTYSLL